jgi:hypothetical protein
VCVCVEEKRVDLQTKEKRKLEGSASKQLQLVEMFENPWIAARERRDERVVWSQTSDCCMSGFQNSRQGWLIHCEEEGEEIF